MADTHSVITRQVPGPTAANASNDAQRHEDSEQTSIEIIMLERYQAECVLRSVILFYIHFFRIIFGVNQYARWLVPESHNRIPITWRTFPNTLAYFIPLIFMAYLARRPNTHIIRLLLLPTLLTTSLRSCFGYMWTDPKMNVYNWGEGTYNYCLWLYFVLRNKTRSSLPRSDGKGYRVCLSEKRAIQEGGEEPGGHSKTCNKHERL